MKRIISILVCLTLLITIHPIYSQDTEPMNEDYTEVILNNATVNVGDSVVISIYIVPQDGYNINLVELTNVNFSADKLQCTGTSWGNLFESQVTKYLPTINNTAGTLNESQWASDVNTSTPGYYYNMTFDTISPGTAYVEVNKSGCGIAGGGEDRPETIKDSTITIQGENSTQFYEKPDNPIYGAHLGDGKAYYPSVTYDVNQFSSHGNTSYYKMWYDPGDGTPRLLLSDDGIDFGSLSDSTPMTNLSSAYHPSVIYDSSGFGTGYYYRMYYWDGSTDLSTRVAESTDGINWENDQLITQNSTYPLYDNICNPSGTAYWYHHYGPGNIYYNSSATNTGNNPWAYSFVMTFDTSSEGSCCADGSVEYTGLAYSSDGFNWTRYSNEPIIVATGESSEWDTHYAYHGDIVKISDNNWRLWYSGADDDEDGGKYYAEGIGEAFSYDGLTWYKCENNPVFHFSDNQSGDSTLDWRSYRTYTADVIDNGENLLMYYTGDDHDNRSIGVAQDTQYNEPPVISDENPADGSTAVATSITYQVNITDPDDDLINWTIECSNGQSNSATDDTSGFKTLPLTLSETTTYTIWVNASDDEETTSDIFTFTTGATEIWVDDNADPGWYDSTHLDNIPDAIDTIFNNGTIHVYNGTYTITDELYIDRPMNLLGENREQTIVQRNGGNQHRLLTIEDIGDNYVTVDGFTFQGGYANMTNRNGIGGNILILNSLNATINNSIIKNGFAEQYGGGVQLEAGGNLKNSTVYDCDALNSGMNGGGGVSMRYGGNIVENCFITNCSAPVGGGILLKMGASPPYQNQIIHCTIANNTAHGYYGVYYGGGIASQGSEWTTSEIHDSIIYHNSPNNIMDVDGSLNIYYSCMTPLWGGSGNNNTNGNPNFLYIGNYYESDYYSIDDTSSCWQNSSDDINRGAWQVQNQAPVLGTPDPINGATNTEVAFDWEISISDPDSDLFDWSIESSSGHSNSDTSDTDGIKSVLLICDFSTTYTVWVNVTDGSLSTNESFTFTTKANTPPSIGSPTPANGSINQSLSLTWSVPVDDPEHNLTTTIECTNGDSITYTDVSPDTYSLDINDLGYSTTYTVYVNSTDGIDTTREWFIFTTLASTPPETSNPSPYNGETDVSIECPNFNIQISDPDGDTFDWSIECSSGDSFSDTSDTPGTKFCWFSEYLDYNTTYTVWVNVTENTNTAHSLNEVYTFTTEENTPPTVELNFPFNQTDYLSVYNLLFNCTVSDTGPEDLTVEFHINNSITPVNIGYVYNATTGEVEFHLNSLGGTWWLTHFVTHEWWVVVDDGTNRVQSETWEFGTSAPADINEDRKVDYLDISSLVDDYGESGWFLPGEIGEDIVEDGEIQYQDVSALVFNYLNTY
jgi:hypothetical protein